MKKNSGVVIKFPIKRETVIGNVVANDNLEEYNMPKIKKLVIDRKKKRPIVMGCWTENYSANDGDGC